jgi:hypothetical protein
MFVRDKLSSLFGSILDEEKKQGTLNEREDSVQLTSFSR